MVGRNEKELLAYDEYDSKGSGEWFTDNPIMANEYYIEQAVYKGTEKGLDVYMWEATYDTDEKNNKRRDMASIYQRRSRRMEKGTFKQCLTGLSYEFKRYYHHVKM